MKKTIIFFLLIIFSTNIFADSAFKEYLKKNYKQSEKLLKQSIAKKGLNPLDTYNLAVTLQKEGKTGEAIYYYIQTLQMSPDFNEAKNNLNILAQKNNIKIPEILKKVSSNYDVILISFLIFLYSSSFLLILYLFKPDWKKMVFLVSSILLFFLFSALFAHKYLGKHQIFTVAIANTELKSGPDKALTTIGKIKPGEIVQLYEISGKWGKTKSFQDNIEGWIKLDKIKKIIRKSY